MSKPLLLTLCLLCPSLSYGQSVKEASNAKLDVVLGITSISAASIATGLTAGCLSEGTCKEVMPVMRRWTEDSIPKAVVIRSALQAGLHYLVYRFAPEGKWRTLTLALLAGINVADAVHDIRVARQIENRRHGQ